MKRLIIATIAILMFSSCATKFVLQGQEFKRKPKMPANEKHILIVSFIAGWALGPMVVRKK